MYADNLVEARTQLWGLENDLGKAAMLAQVAQLESLWELIQRSLRCVSNHVGDLNEFYDALVQLREHLDAARQTLQRLENEADDLHFSREVSQEALTVVRTLFRTVSRDLGHLFFWLPSPARGGDRAPPLGLTVDRAPSDTVSMNG